MGARPAVPGPPRALSRLLPMTSPAIPDEPSLPPGPPPLALAIGLDLVTRYRLRLTDARDGRLGPLRGAAYALAAAARTGRRAPLVGLTQRPADRQTPAAARRAPARS